MTELKTKFLFDRIRRDLNTLPKGVDGKPEEEEVKAVLEFWEANYDEVNGLSELMARLESIIYGDFELTMKDRAEALGLVMRIHMPLISNENDVLGVRLRDANLMRIHNRIMGLPIENDIEDYANYVRNYHEALKKKQASKERRRMQKAQEERDTMNKEERARAEFLSYHIADVLGADATERL